MPIRSPELLDRVWAAVFAAKYDTDVEEAVLDVELEESDE